MKKKIKAVIVDDEISFVSSLEILLKMNFADVQIVANADSVKSAVEMINEHKPDLVFLDINLPDGDGFDVLQQTNKEAFKTIFTTSMSGYAIKAFDFAALHYLVKPLKLDKLQEAMGRYNDIHNNNDFDTKLRILKESLPGKPEKIFLPLSNGMVAFNLSDIVRCQAEDNCCMVYLNNGKHELITRPLQSLHTALNDLDFVRIHSKHLINLRYIKQYKSGRQPCIILSDDTELPISQTYRNEVSLMLKQYAIAI